MLITFVHQELGVEDTEMNQKHFCVNLSLQASRNHIKPELKSTGGPIAGGAFVTPQYSLSSTRLH